MQAPPTSLDCIRLYSIALCWGGGWFWLFCWYVFITPQEMSDPIHSSTSVKPEDLSLAEPLGEGCPAPQHWVSFCSRAPESASSRPGAQAGPLARQRGLAPSQPDSGEQQQRGLWVTIRCSLSGESLVQEFIRELGQEPAVLLGEDTPVTGRRGPRALPPGAPRGTSWPARWT